MTVEEYKQGIIDLDVEFKQRKNQLSQKYAFSNNTIKKDDIITDSIGSVKVQSIMWSYNPYDSPCCVYVGLVLKKDGTPTKKEEVRKVYQSNLIK